MPRRRRAPSREMTQFAWSDAFYDLKADFNAGKDSRFHSRLTGVQHQGSGADYHYRNEIQWLHMLERARHYRRQDQVVGQAIRRLVSNVVQEGFSLDVRTEDSAVNAELKSRWNDWSEDPDQCHSEAELDFHQLERMTLDAMITDGDLLHLPLKDVSLQPVEAHRLRTPSGTRRNVVHGVLLDERARRREYWIAKRDIGLEQTLSRVNQVKRYRARDSEGHRQVLHVYDPYRFSQTRGVTALAPVSFTIGAHDDVQFATLVKQQMGALIAILRERTEHWTPSPTEAALGDQETETEGGYTKTIEGMSAGLDIASDKGEKLSMFASNIPGPQFLEHTQLLLTFIAINLDLPVAVLLLDPRQTNFSGWRGAIDQARGRWRQIQRHLVSNFHRPVYRWWIRHQLEQDASLRKLHESGAIDAFAHRWNSPRWPYIEPLKDAAADELQDAKLLNSKRRIHANRGADWDDVSGEIVEDNALVIDKAIAKAGEINRKYPDAKVDWREILRVPTADSVAARMDLGKGEEKNEPDDSSQIANG